MKSLYSSIKESLLGDIEKTINNVDDAAIDLTVNDSSSELHRVFDLSRPDVGRKYPLKYENDTLYIPRSFVRTHDGKTLSNLVGMPVDHLVMGGTLQIQVYNNNRILSGDTFCKKITCGSGIRILSYRVNDLELSIGRLDDIGIKKFPSSHRGTVFDGVVSIENVTWESDTNTGIVFDCDRIPDIKNCTFKGLNTITIYSPFLFDNEKLTKEIQTKWMLPKYDYAYKGKTGDDVVTIKNFKKLHSIINQRKKYPGGIIKCFKDDIKASDIVPWINSIPGVKNVILENNNVSMYLCKAREYFSRPDGLSLSVNAVTADGWEIILEKKKH